MYPPLTNSSRLCGSFPCRRVLIYQLPHLKQVVAQHRFRACLTDF
jgi:hypothetical protein